MPKRNRDRARSLVFGPALGLMIASILTILLVVMAIVFNMLLLSGDLADRIPIRPAAIDQTKVFNRMGGELVMLLLNIVILVGSSSMMKLRGLGLSWTACFLSLIP